MTNQLTHREINILQLIGEGLTNREIATRLTIELSTVKWYIRKIYAHLNVTTRGEAVRQSVQLGVVVIEDKSQIPHCLPTSLTRFVGRKTELAQLDNFLNGSTGRLVTVVAAGGMGKSRLALAWGASQLKNRSLFPDGLFFVPLAPLSESSQIASAINQTLGITPDKGEQRSADQQLIDYLLEKKLLLILDNFEHLLDGADFISTILKQAPGIHLLVTSRERLRLYGEQLLPLKGLLYPTQANASEIQTSHPAVDLFLRTAQRFRPDLRITAETFPPIVQICHFVEGMPLGLELAAGWVDSIPIINIAQRLAKGYEMLATDLRDVPERQRSIWAVFEGTWQQLDSEKQLAFAKLSVFRGLFTAEAAAEIADCTPTTLQRLGDKSLVQELGDGWFGLHELLRQFGASKLAADHLQEAAAQHAHALFYTHLLSQWAPSLFTSQQYKALKIIGRHFENIKKGWLWCIENGEIAMLESAVDGLGYFCNWQGLFNDGAALFSPFTQLEQLENRSQNEQATLAKSLAWLADFVNIRGDTASAEQLLGRASAQLENNDSPASLTSKAFVYHQKGWHTFGRNAEHGRENLQKSLNLYQHLEDAWGIAEASFGLGRILHDLGRFDEAIYHYNLSLDIRKQLGDQRGQALLLAWMSNTLVYTGHDVDGIKLASESVALCRALGEKLLLINCIGRLGANLVWQGRYVEAQKLQTETLELYKQMGNRTKLPRAYTRLSVTEMGVGDIVAATSHAQIGIQLAKKVGDQTVVGFALWVLGYLKLIESADNTAGYELFKESVQI
ncbi:MAG: DNA-binding CsgD family transcriptional regulator/tetratricopeptide (TPR) repeat protein, partial [Candidatus Promineifilaceae bacterium]